MKTTDPEHPFSPQETGGDIRPGQIRVLLSFKAEVGVTWLTEMAVLPKVGEVFETGVQTWLVQAVELTPEHPKHAAVVSLRKNEPRT